MKQRSGFTLIDVLVVIAILALLAATVAPDVFRHMSGARSTTAAAQLEMLAAALDAYRLDNGVYPTSAQGLMALWREPTSAPTPMRWRGPYLRKEPPPDPWGTEYEYRGREAADGRDFMLRSLGSDARPGGDGDAADIEY